MKWCSGLLPYKEVSVMSALGTFNLNSYMPGGMGRKKLILHFLFEFECLFSSFVHESVQGSCRNIKG